MRSDWCAILINYDIEDWNDLVWVMCHKGLSVYEIDAFFNLMRRSPIPFWRRLAVNRSNAQLWPSPQKSIRRNFGKSNRKKWYN